MFPLTSNNCDGASVPTPILPVPRCIVNLFTESDM